MLPGRLLQIYVSSDEPEVLPACVPTLQPRRPREAVTCATIIICKNEETEAWRGK